MLFCELNTLCTASIIFSLGERKRTKVRCTECGEKMEASSLCNHMERSHIIVLPHNRGVDVGGRGMETYVVSFPRIMKLVECQVEGYPAIANNPWRLMDHLMY